MLRLPILCASVLALSACAAVPPDGAGSAASAAVQAQHEAALRAAIAGEHRDAAQRTRDAYRRPFETLSFWGLRPGMTVVEIGPGEGWWTEILAPYAARTGGRYVMALSDTSNPAMSAAARQRVDAFEARYRAKPELYGDFGRTAFGRQTGPFAPAGSVDMILVARAFHNWAGQEGFTDKAMRDFAAALKPGGVLAVEQHRLAAGQPERPQSGYVTEQYVIDAAQRAGLVLDARSELNANPKDDTDHPFGVWTLPPIRRSSAESGKAPDPTFDRAAYDAIGESDRMTLRFRKPG
jgi:predicted methyltransferase